MKKALAICFAVLMTVIFSVNVCAASNFIASPSSQTAPKILEAKNDSPDCTGTLAVASYSERENLPQNYRKSFEDACQTVLEADNLTDLCANLLEIAQEKKVATESLAISDLFEIYCEGCPDHADHGDFHIRLTGDTLNHFVGLATFEEGQWSMIENVKIEKINGEYYLTFTFGMKDFAPFAIIVDRDETIDIPDTGASDFSFAPVAAFVVLASAAALFAVYSKKKEWN